MAKFLYIMAIALTFFVAKNDSTMFNAFHVHITSRLGAGKTLTVRCKSGDDDLGIHKLNPGERYTINFKLNFFATTLFWCDTSPNKTHYRNFRVFWWGDDFMLERCSPRNNCYWIFKNEGVYLRNIKREVNEFRYTWKRKYSKKSNLN
ncbi:S-protein homolog 74-like [Mercurialis annua]|uniref:S-protein homolog 74-like n=1 Tax=Mercurialis annua TaxID=3986 RepID=UPI00215FD9AE|nr:S-protein homolog 74-like [Mercurialis annua]